MSPKDYLSWLDSEIEKAEKLADREDRRMEPYAAYRGRAEALDEARNLFITIQFPSQLTDTETPDPRDFTEGLD